MIGRLGSCTKFAALPAVLWITAAPDAASAQLISAADRKWNDEQSPKMEAENADLFAGLTAICVSPTPEGMGTYGDEYSAKSLAQDADGIFADAYRLRKSLVGATNLIAAATIAYKNNVDAYDQLCSQRGAASQHGECFRRWLGIGAKPGSSRNERDMASFSRMALAATTRDFLTGLKAHQMEMRRSDFAGTDGSIARLNSIEAQEEKFLADYRFLRVVPGYDDALGRAERLSSQCNHTIRQYLVLTHGAFLAREANKKQRSSEIAALMAPFRFDDPLVRAGLPAGSDEPLKQIDARFIALRNKEEAQARADLLRRQELARIEAARRATAERAAAAQRTAALAARKRTLLAAATTSAGVDAPSSDEITSVYIDSNLRYARYDIGPGAGELAEKGLGGVATIARFDVQGLVCSKVERNSWSCSYMLGVTRRGGEDGSLASKFGAVGQWLGVTLLGEYFEPPASRRQNVFTFRNGAWRSERIDETIDRREAASRSSTTSADIANRPPQMRVGLSAANWLAETPELDISYCPPEC